MDFAWAVTDKTKNPPGNTDTFQGYFTDIQRAARRSLPKKPDRDLCQLLGLSLVPAGNETERAKEINGQIQESTKDITDVKEDNLTAESGLKENKQTFAENVLSMLPCRNNEEGDCSKREKFISSFAVYFAIVIFILLIIVIILAASISAFSKNDGTGDSSSHGSPDRSISTLGPLTSITQTMPSPGYSQSASPASTTLSTSPFISSSIKASKATTRTSMSTPSSSATDVKTSPTPTVQKNITRTTLSQSNTSTTSATASTSGLSRAMTTRTVSMTSAGIPSSTASPSAGIPSSTSLPTETSSKATSYTLVPVSTTFITTSGVSSRTETTSRVPFTPSVSTSIPRTATTSHTTNPQSTASFTSTSIYPGTVNTTLNSTGSISTTTTMTSTSIKPRTTSTIVTPTTPVTNTSTNSPSTSPAPPPLLERPFITCTTPACRGARTTLDRVSFSTSPCEDFYEFACGRWINQTADQYSDSSQSNVPSTLREEFRTQLLKQLQVLLQSVYYSTDSFSSRVVKRLYQSCIESNINGDSNLALEELREILQDFQMSIDGTIQADIDTILTLARRRFEITPLFKMTTTILANENNKKLFGMQISPPELYLGLEDYLDYSPLAQFYVTRVSEVLQIYLSTFNINGIPGVPGTRRKRASRSRRQFDGISYEQVYLKVLQSFSIDRNISQIIAETKNQTSEQTPNSTVTYVELKATYANINWDAALEVRSNTALIRVTHPDYFQALDAAIANFNKADLKLFVFMSVLIQRVWTYMPYPFRIILRDVNINSNVRYTQIDCVEKTVELAHEETHSLYIDQYTQEVLNNRLSIANLKNTISDVFELLLSRTGWVTSDLQLVATVFLKNTRLAFSSVKNYITETEGLLGLQQSFLIMAMELHQQKEGYVRFLVDREVNENNIVRDWTSTELFYESSLDIIGIPTGTAVFTNNDNQPNFDYHGYIGFILTEQIIQVMTGDMVNGVAPEWWGEKNINQFLPIKQCFEQQLALEPEGSGDIGSIIIGNGALDTTYEVFRSTTPLHTEFITDTTISEEMVFMINSAQLDCKVNNNEQHKWRVNNRISNNVRFAEIFACPRHSPMIPDEICHVFT